LALPKLRQKDIIYRSFSTPGADDWFLEIGSHGLVVDPDYPNITVEFLVTPLAFKVNLHVISSCFLANDKIRSFENREAIEKSPGLPCSKFHLFGKSCFCLIIRRVAVKAPARPANDISPVATVITTKGQLDSPNARNTRKLPKQNTLTMRSDNFNGDK